MKKESTDIHQLIASGYGVSKLRTAGFSPAEIRAAGFSLEEMHVHLGIHRLIEAGFQLEDFQRANFSVGEILLGKFPLDLVLKDNPRRYPLKELMQIVPPDELRTVAGYRAEDFLLLRNISATDLKRFGFSSEEISAAMVHFSRPAVPGPLQPPNAVSMAVGEYWNFERTGDASTFLKIRYTRLRQAEAEIILERPHPYNLKQSSYSYDGSGRHCPRCGRLFVLLEKYTSSDGMCGVERGKWICDDPSCGMEKEENYEGYGSIF
jgi:hypothetical protein